MGFARFPALCPTHLLLPVYKLRLKSLSLFARAHALRSLPLVDSRPSSPSDLAFLQLVPLAPDFLRRVHLLLQRPLLQGVAPSTSPFCFLCIAAKAAIGTPMGLFPLQGLPVLLAAHPTLQSDVAASQMPSEILALASLSSCEPSLLHSAHAYALARLRNPAGTFSSQGRSLSIQCPPVCPGVPVDTPSPSPLDLPPEGFWPRLTTLTHRSFLGFLTSKINPRINLLGPTPGLPGCRKEPLQIACQLSHFVISTT